MCDIWLTSATNALRSGSTHSGGTNGTPIQVPVFNTVFNQNSNMQSESPGLVPFSIPNSASSQFEEQVRSFNPVSASAFNNGSGGGTPNVR